MCRYRRVSPATYRRNTRARYLAQKPDKLTSRRGKRDELSPPPSEFRISKRPRVCKQTTAKELHLPFPQSNQPGCMLLNRLPAEIRLHIWELVVGGQELHILKKEKKLGHRVCTRKIECYHCELVRRPYYPSEPPRKVEPFPADEPLAERSLLPLILSCRQIYSEAIELLYTTNVFDFPSLWALEFLQDTTLPKRFASIRHISLRHTFDATQFEDTVTIMWFPPRLIPFPSPEKTWETTMKALKAMTGLRELEFRVLRSPFYSSSLSRTVMGGGVITPFEPLKKVSQKLDRFLIKVADMEGWYRVDVGTMERTLNSKGVKCEVVLNTDEQVSILGPPRLPYTVQ